MAEYDQKKMDRDAAKVQDTLQRFAEATTWRNNFAQQWEEVASLILPAHRNTFMVGASNFPGMKMTEQQVDATGMMALQRFSAICDSLLTPRNMVWHGLSANDPYVMKDRATRLWFEDTTRRLFKYRYDREANFASQNHSNYEQLGAFGTMGMFIDRLYSQTGKKGLRYRSLPVGEIFLFENHQGQVDEFMRYFRLTARQAKQEFPETFPAFLQPALEKGSQEKHEFLHHVWPKKDVNYDRLNYEGMPYGSCYVCIPAKALLDEGGFQSFPAAFSRYTTAPGEIYGRSPAMHVLPSLKTLNAEKRTFLKAGHRTADPILLIADDGIIPNLRPGAAVPGGLAPDGTPRMKALELGNIQISEEMMAAERSIINDSFLVSLFQILEETPQMSATEVLERINEKGILIAPTMGRQQSEYVGGIIPRELDLLGDMQLLAPMPPRLKEAGGEYEIEYTSPLSRMARSQESVGFFRVVESVKEIVNITGDPAPLDRLNFDKAVAGIAEQQSVPEEWLSSDAEVAEKRAARAKAQQVQTQIQAAPAAAAMLKAQAMAGKNGAPPPGQQPQPEIVQ